MTDFASTTPLEKSNDFAELVSELRVLLCRSKFIISGYGDDDVRNLDSNGVGSALLLATTSISQDKETIDEVADSHNGLVWKLPAGAKDGSNSATSRGSIALPSNEHNPVTVSSAVGETVLLIPRDSESDSGDSLSTESSSDIYSFLQCRTECLLDLVPTIERNIIHAVKLTAKPPTSLIPFSMTEAARPFILRIADKFTNASNKLVERLGEANWQRFVQIRTRMDVTSV